MTRTGGYYRFPTISGDSIVFVSEDDLWSVPVKGGTARRLTAGHGECSSPRFSPDGKMLAYVARDEGHPEVYVMPAEGGDARRITFQGSWYCGVAGWSADGKRVIFASNAQARHVELFEIDANGGMPRVLNFGHAVSIATSESGATVLGRNSNDPARWKRYRGGTAGDLWVDAKGNGKFKRLLDLKTNLASPMFIKGRIYFISDHEGIGNIYSCKPDGSGIKRHTHHNEYYVRFPSTDGNRIVYACGASLYVLDPQTDAVHPVAVRMSSSARQAVRRFVPVSNHLEHYALHPEGHSIGVISRGQPFTMPFWEEAVLQHGVGSKVRYRCLQWLPCGTHFVVVNDQSHFERLEVHKADQTEEPYFATNTDIGRVVDMVMCQVANKVAISNHKHELLMVNLDDRKVTVLDRSPCDRIGGMSWSPDGRWIAYSFSPHPNCTNVRVVDTVSGEFYDVTRPIRYDFCTSWDPAGNYLYFLSTRDFNPVYDSVGFDLSFPFGVRPYLVTLRKDVQSPFVPKTKPFIEGATQPPKPETASGDQKADAGAKVESKPEQDKHGRAQPGRRVKGKTAAHKQKGNEPKISGAGAAPTAAVPGAPAIKPIEIDFDGITDRILVFPVEEGRYVQIAGLHGRALFTQFPVKGIKRGHSWWNAEPEMGRLFAYDFNAQRSGVLQDNVASFVVGRDNRTIVYQSRKRLRVYDGSTAIPDAPSAGYDEVNRRGGWIDLDRAHVMIEPYAEWEQMFHETWRLQREHFWDESMSNIDWDLVYERYAALLPRVSSRTELSDLIWEMQGELGTSHAYEFGGDHRHPPSYYRGHLGAELSFDSKTGGYRIDKILRGDSWDAGVDSPLATPGLGIKEGDIILAVGGRATSKTCGVDELLLNTAGKDVMLTIKTGDKKRSVAVKTLWEDRTLRYRNWVETNRKYVHEKTKGRIGYIHIPDMGPFGFAEFHRYYLSEIHHEGVIVDVRYNGGGHVSPLLLEKLARKRVGYDVSRWGVPMPYPPESVAGPMVAITNQFAGSDGDIFSHCFKLYELGPLVGKRTWGGVIGIWPRHALVDGTVTTQPEFSFWFIDARWGVENYGTDPDYDVDIAPQDYREGRDPQMDKAIDLIQNELKKNPFKLPKFDKRPSLALPKLKKTTAKLSK